MRTVQICNRQGQQEAAAAEAARVLSNSTEAEKKPPLSRTNINPLEGVLEELSMHISILSSHAAEFRALAVQATMGNVWLSTAEVARVKQELVQRAMNQSAVMQHLLSVVVAMHAAVEDEELGYASTVEVLDQLRKQYISGKGHIHTTHHDRFETSTHQVLKEINKRIRAAKEQKEREKREELRKKGEELRKKKYRLLREKEEAEKMRKRISGARL